MNKNSRNTYDYQQWALELEKNWMYISDLCCNESKGKLGINSGQWTMTHCICVHVTIAVRILACHFIVSQNNRASKYLGLIHTVLSTVHANSQTDSPFVPELMPPHAVSFVVWSYIQYTIYVWTSITCTFNQWQQHTLYSENRNELDFMIIKGNLENIVGSQDHSQVLQAINRLD